MMPTLQEYCRFHGMLIGPSAACRCLLSFNGRVLFMPSSYKLVQPTVAFPLSTVEHENDKDKITTRPPDRISPWDHAPSSMYNPFKLSIWSYYALVLYSLTGLSTLLGLTETIEAREVQDEFDETLQKRKNPNLLRSTVTPSLQVNHHVLRYLEDFKASSQNVQNGTPRAVVVRRFEYIFKLSRIRVIMLHFKTMLLSENENAKPNSATTTKFAKDKDGKDLLHLVEVYQVDGIGKMTAAVVVGATVMACTKLVSWSAAKVLAVSRRW